jgi:integrase
VTKIAFSDTKLRSLPSPTRGQTAYWDDKLPGFGIRVSQGGTKTFVLKHSNSLITIGKFGILSLAEARSEAKHLSAEFILGRVRPPSISFPAAVEEFLDEKAARRRPITVADHKRHLGLLGFRGPLADVSQADLSRKLKPLPRSEFNHRLSCAKTFFTWAQKKRYISDNPTSGFTPHTIASRSRVLTDEELKAVWIAAEQIGGHFGTIVKLLILTGMRRGECAALRKDYVVRPSQEIAHACIRLPATLTKNGRDHMFPIGAFALSALADTLAKDDASLLFPARGKSETPFNGWSKCKTALDKLANIAPWTLHDLRRTFATDLAQMGVAPHVVERLINHVTGSIAGVAAIYNRATYLNEMADAVQLWENKLISLSLS